MSNTVHQFSSAAKFASEGGSENGTTSQQNSTNENTTQLSDSYILYDANRPNGMTKHEVLNLHHTLVQHIRTSSLMGIPLGFKAVSSYEGFLKVIPTTEESLIWLQDNCDTFGYQMKSINDIPVLVKVSVFVPNETRPGVEIMNQLAGQNGYKPDHWVFLWAQNDKRRDGVYLTFKISKFDASRIKKNGDKLYIDFGSVMVEYK